MNLNATALQFAQARPVTDRWLSPAQVANRLHMSTHNVYHVFSERNEYRQVRRKVCGTAGKKSARGQGHVFYAEDIDQIARIKWVLGVHPMTAAKVFAAQRLGKI